MMEEMKAREYVYSSVETFALFKVKAMRFTPKSYNKELESAEDRRV